VSQLSIALGGQTTLREGRLGRPPEISVGIEIRQTELLA
jgi:hypothetical protein